MPKSNSACLAIELAMNDLEYVNFGDVPIHLQDAHYSGAEKLGVSGYKYPNYFPENYVKQQYLPGELQNTIYYIPQRNKYEKKYR